MDTNLPVSVGEQTHLRRKKGKTKRRAVIFALAALVLLSLAAYLLLSGGKLAGFFENIFSGGTTGAQSQSGAKSGNDIYSFDFSSVPDGCTAVMPVDLTLGESETFAAVALPKNAGRVLVISTRPFESYLESDATYVESDAEFYGGDCTTGAVAAYLASKLRTLGVDAEYLALETSSGVGAYKAAEDAIEKYKKENGVGYVVDVGRAVAVGDGGEILRPIVQSGDEIVAQTTLIAAKGGKFFDTRAGNAAALSEAMNERAEKSAVAVSKDGVRAQNTDAAFITAQIGACGNTYREAIRAASLFAEALAGLIK